MEFLFIIAAAAVLTLIFWGLSWMMQDASQGQAERDRWERERHQRVQGMRQQSARERELPPARPWPGERKGYVIPPPLPVREREPTKTEVED